MCVYCSMGDHTWKYDPPFQPSQPIQYIPYPVIQQPAWSLERLKEYYDLLKAVKELEDRLGCPCEPAKADHLGILKARIDELEKRIPR